MFYVITPQNTGDKIYPFS